MLSGLGEGTMSRAARQTRRSVMNGILRALRRAQNRGSGLACAAISCD